MIKPLRFQQIANKFKIAILNSELVNNFCVKNFGKKPNILIGTDIEQLVRIENCPAICIFPDSKIEGLEIREYQYSFIVGWSIENEDIEQTEQTYEMKGWKLSDEFGNLLYEELRTAGNYQISTANFQMFSGFQPQYPGFFTATINITAPLGATEINF